MKLGTTHGSKVKKWTSSGAKGMGMVPTTNSTKTPGFKSKTKGATDPTCC